MIKPQIRISLMRAYEVLDFLASQPDDACRLEALHAVKIHNPGFGKALNLLYNPTIVFGFETIPDFQPTDEIDEFAYANLLGQLNIFPYFLKSWIDQHGLDRATKLFLQNVEICEKRDVPMFVGILLKDPTCLPVSTELVQEVYPEIFHQIVFE
jgi:hypothetical protein